MGTVHLTRRESDGQLLALKFARDDSASHVAGLRREIRALSCLRERGIVRMHDHGSEERIPWYAMDLIMGGTLQSYAARIWRPYRNLRTQAAATAIVLSEPVATGVDGFTPFHDTARRELPPIGAGQLRELAEPFRALCRTVSYLHQHDCTHGDLKPSNILLAAHGPVLIDFGQCRRRGDAHMPRAHGGTAEYCSPEQVRGVPIGPESDLYALGCVFYELATGCPLFAGRAENVLAQQLSGAPLLASRCVRNVSAELDQALARLLSKTPADRPAALEALLTALP